MTMNYKDSIIDYDVSQAWLTDNQVLDDINLVSKFSCANVPFKQITIAKTWGRGGTTGQLCELKLPQQRDIIARAPGRGRGRGAALQEEGYTMEETVPCRLTSTGLEELKRKAGINTSFTSGLNQMQTQFNNMNHSKFKTKDFPALNK